jgi:branched-chain amino acid transport system substrate-binding protein
MKSGILFTAAIVCGLAIAAPASAQQGVKIEITSMTSPAFMPTMAENTRWKPPIWRVEDFGGSVLGQKIEIVTADHQNKPDLAGAIARRWCMTPRTST